MVKVWQHPFFDLVEMQSEIFNFEIIRKFRAIFE